MLLNASFDSCAEEPCQHNSTCTELGDRAWCACPVHYTGQSLDIALPSSIAFAGGFGVERCACLIFSSFFFLA